jgi:hypothetical protein
MTKLLVLAGVLLFAVPLSGLAFASALPSSMNAMGTQPSSRALADIPADALRDYQDAAQTCPGLSWTVLAGIGKVESDHGRSQLPGVHSGQNSAGAMGPMQFLQATWAAYHLPGMGNVYAHRDASFAAAHLLCANGAGTASRLGDAIFAYNHTWWYVAEVLSWAGIYAAANARTIVTGDAAPGDPFGGLCAPVVTQLYGPTTVQGEPIVNGQLFHSGIDLACPAGTPIYSVTAGTAHVTTVPKGGGWGNNIAVEAVTRMPGDVVPQRYFVRYAHLLGNMAVADGATVRAGDLLGLEGSTGFSSGPHLHFEIDRGQLDPQRSIDPTVLLTVPAGGGR